MYERGWAGTSSSLADELSWLEKMIGNTQPTVPLDDVEYEQNVKDLKAKAACRLGTIYEHGAEGIAVSRELAIAYYKKALQFSHEYVRALQRLAVLEPTPDIIRGLSSPKAEADASAQCLLGKRAFERREYQHAVDCFRKVAADKEAQYFLGLCLEQALGVAQDKVNALEHFKVSAEQGYAPSIALLKGRLQDAGVQCVFGKLHRLGKGVPKDEAASLRFLLSAHNGKCPEAILELINLAQTNIEAQYALGALYEQGKGVSFDKNEAAAFYQKAAFGNHQLAVHALIRLAEGKNIKAMLVLAELYELVENMRNYEKGREWLARAYDTGSAEAGYLLATRYLQGMNVTKDERKGVEWLAKAARMQYRPALAVLRDRCEKNCPHSVYAQGCNFAEDARSSKNPAADIYWAEYWFKKAAALKHGPACMRLAEIAESQSALSVQTPEEILLAYKQVDEYYKKAVECGFEEAISQRERISAILAGFDLLARARSQKGLGQVSFGTLLFLRLKERLPKEISYETYYWAAHICGVVSEYYDDTIHEAICQALQMIATYRGRDRIAYAHLRELSTMLLSSEFLDNPLYKSSESLTVTGILAVCRRAQLAMGDLADLFKKEKYTRSERALNDYLIDVLNKRMFSDESIDEREYRNAVRGILSLFQSLQNIIKKQMLWDEKNRQLADEYSLHAFLIYSQVNRHKRSVVRIHRLLNRVNDRDFSAYQLCLLALAGLYPEVRAAEEATRLDRFHVFYEIDPEAEKYDLPLLIAVLLADARGNAIKRFVEYPVIERWRPTSYSKGSVQLPVCEPQCHVSYLKSKIGQRISFIGIAESNRVRESLLGPIYKGLTVESLVERVLQDYNEVDVLFHGDLKEESIMHYFERHMGKTKANDLAQHLFTDDEASTRRRLTEKGAKILLFYFGYFD